MTSPPAMARAISPLLPNRPSSPLRLGRPSVEVSEPGLESVKWPSLNISRHRAGSAARLRPTPGNMSSPPGSPVRPPSPFVKKKAIPTDPATQAYLASLKPEKLDKQQEFRESLRRAAKGEKGEHGKKD